VVGEVPGGVIVGDEVVVDEPFDRASRFECAMRDL
jgi:hypothetical protein